MSPPGIETATPRFPTADALDLLVTRIDVLLRLKILQKNQHMAIQCITLVMVRCVLQQTVRQNRAKQNRSTEGCSKLKRSVDMTSSGMNGLNIRTNASRKLDRTRCPEEEASSICSRRK